ncbi:DUF4815 domain-containing protein [Terrarubrum flagellatum]|uniref:DUF4815 domain-containing protein n=1 Tax=Terrirubrum flagellatum TaxID=2895980 RepID=UPI0031451DCD
MAFEHPSGVPGAFDRASANPNWARVVAREDRFAQAAEINELQSIAERRGRRVGNLTAKDGDRVEGCNIVVDVDAGTITLAAGRIYVAGDVRNVAAHTFSGVTFSGEKTVGIRLLSTVVDEDDDVTLLGLMPGTEGEGEPGAARVAETISWALPDDDGDGEYFAVYLLLDGAVIDQSPPPALSGVTQQIAVYDKDALGNYIVDGCEVTALGKTGSDQAFTIAAGTANIQGFKRIREASIRFVQAEDPALESITAEPHTFTGTTGGTSVVPVSRPPIANVTGVVIVKRVTETVTRGASPNGEDALSNSAVVAIESVSQGAMTYVATTDYLLDGDKVSWAPGGAEPAAASTYSVTYRYNASVTPDTVDETSVTVTGGVNGSTALISYQSKIPRIDIICMDIAGKPVYYKGISARGGALAPAPPSTLLKLAEVWNDWLSTPEIVNNGTHNYTADAQRRLFNRLIDILEQFDRAELSRDILEREPVSKKGIFTDSFVDDFYRDQGAAQTAAINQGVLQLAIDNVLMQRAGTAIVSLDYTEEIAIRQDKDTSSMAINPYDNFTVMPGALKLEPAVDFWTDEVTAWASPVTREFTSAPDEPPGQTTITEVTEIRKTEAVNLRQITVHATIQGFGAGENLATLTLDGVNVKPAGTQTADSNGQIVLDFVIPANIPSGKRKVRAVGAATDPSFAEAIFVGEGTVDTTTLRRVTLVARAAPVPITVVNENITIINQVTQPVVQDVDRSTEGVGGSAEDPLAQTFVLPEPRHILGVNVKIKTIGDPTKGVRVQLATIASGLPTKEILAEVFVSLAGKSVNDVIQARFAAPVFCPSDREFCFVFLTDDNAHALAISKLGDVDPVTQQRVSAQPYTVGVLLSSSNRSTWTAHNDADLWFEVVVAKFSPTTKTVTLWTGAITNISDMLIRGGVEIPTADARFRYELVREGGQVIPLAPNQTCEFAEFVTETVTVRAVFDGSEKVSPVLYPGTLIIGGRIKTSGTYISRQFPMGTAIRVQTLFAAKVPAGAAVAVHCDAADNSWNALSADGSGTLGGGWNEPRFKKDPYTAANGRIRVTLTGDPGARPSIARLRAYSV